MISILCLVRHLTPRRSTIWANLENINVPKNNKLANQQTVIRKLVLCPVLQAPADTQNIRRTDRIRHVHRLLHYADIELSVLRLRGM